MASDISQLVRQIKKQNFKIEDTNGGHIRVTNQTGDYVIIPSTPSGGRRSLDNSVADLKRIGFDPRGRANPVKKAAAKESPRGKLLAIFEVLQTFPEIELSAQEIWSLMGQEATGMSVAQVSSNLSYLCLHHPEIERPERGKYLYRAEVPVPHPAEPEPYIEPYIAGFDDSQDACVSTPPSDKVAAVKEPQSPSTPQTPEKEEGSHRKAYSCRECGAASKDVPSLFFPRGLIKAPSVLCVDCVDRLRHPDQTTRDFVKAYIEANTDPLKLAERRIKELEERLAIAQKTIENLNPSHR
jgi:hypothetical protein